MRIKTPGRENYDCPLEKKKRPKSHLPSHQKSPTSQIPHPLNVPNSSTIRRITQSWTYRITFYPTVADQSLLWRKVFRWPSPWWSSTRVEGEEVYRILQGCWGVLCDRTLLACFVRNLGGFRRIVDIADSEDLKERKILFQSGLFWLQKIRAVLYISACHCRTPKFC